MPYHALSCLFDLEEVKFNRRLAPEDADHDLQPPVIHIDLIDVTDKVGEGPVDDPDVLTLLELGLHLRRRPPLELLEDDLDFLLRKGYRPCSPHETGDTGGAPHEVPRFIIEFHLDEDIAGVELLFALPFLPAPELDDPLR